MTLKPFLILCSMIFTAITALHLMRFFLNWEVIINGVVIPRWPSLIAIVISGYLQYCAAALLKKTKG